jgi:hypothetical protein
MRWSRSAADLVRHGAGDRRCRTGQAGLRRVPRLDRALGVGASLPALTAPAHSHEHRRGITPAAPRRWRDRTNGSVPGVAFHATLGSAGKDPGRRWEMNWQPWTSCNSASRYSGECSSAPCCTSPSRPPQPEPAASQFVRARSGGTLRLRCNPCSMMDRSKGQPGGWSRSPRWRGAGG